MYTLLITLLIVAGILLLLAEFLLVPGVGVPGVLGLCCLIAACFFGFFWFGNTVGAIITAAVSLLLLGLFIYALRSKTWKKVALNDEIVAKTGELPPSVDAGSRGVTETRLAPMGTARFGDSSTEVKSDNNEMIEPGTPVEVVRIEDNRIIVKKSE
ncbi:MAG: NfeD family protein [Bacteroidales bacterium]|nr:NfeD family protein [Bacteroidales bacterium]